MSCAEVIFSNLLSFRVELDRCIETTELFVLLTDAQRGHDHDGYEVIELVFQGVRLRVGTFGPSNSFIFQLLSQAIAALPGKSESLARVLKSFFISVQETVAVGQVEVSLSKWEQILFTFWLFG